MMVLKENKRMIKEDGGSPQLLIAAKDGERGRNRKKKGYHGGRSKSQSRDMSIVECFYCGDTDHMYLCWPQFTHDLKSLS